MRKESGTKGEVFAALSLSASVVVSWFTFLRLFVAVSCLSVEQSTRVLLPLVSTLAERVPLFVFTGSTWPCLVWLSGPLLSSAHWRSLLLT